MTTHYLNDIHDVVRPSDVFGDEPTNAAGYARESVELTLTEGQEVRCGTIINVNHLTGVATLVDTSAIEEIAASTTTMKAAIDTQSESLTVFFKRDVLVDPFHFEHLKASFAKDGEKAKVVVITRGDGSAQISPSFLDFNGSDFYSLSETAQKFVKAYFEQSGRFKWIKQQKRVV